MSSAAIDNPQAGAGRPLPKKEADLFKNVVKHYEMKQYKKAIKQADTILKKFPNHGETLAMKGLTLNYMSKRDEAHALVKQGLKMDMRSHVCWHVYGLLHRSDRNYNEAIKAYKQALRIDSDNLQILRDLSMLQIQMRDLHGFMVTRHTLLTLKSNGKPNWLAFALARHLTGDIRGAISVIDIYLGTLTEGSPELDRGFESSELALYRNSLLAELPNNYEEALKHLDDCKGVVVDRGAWMTARAKYQLKLGDFDAAHKTVLQLFERGMTDDFRVHSLYMMCILKMNDEKIVDNALQLKGTQTLASYLPLSNEQKRVLLTAYQEELSPLYPKSYGVQRIPLTLIHDQEELTIALDQFCRKDLTKGVPSLCSELACLMLIEKDGVLVKAGDPVDIRSHPTFKSIVTMVDGYVENLTACNKFAASDKSEEAPSTLLWTLYLRAGFFELEADYIKAVQVLDKCLEHTPTAVDVYELKARILRAAGDVKAAVDTLDQGRDLDRQDRYINNQTTRYMLLAGMEEEALKRISLFTRHEGNPEQNLFDMQCSWYELELAACMRRKCEWGRSLKKYAAVVKHFADYSEDQFDFHAYCLRKVTLRSYIEVLRFEDKLYGEDYYFEAASGIIEIYLHLYDNPGLTISDEEPDYSNMTAAERKKAKSLARRKKAQEKKDAEQKEKEAEQNGKSNNASNKKSKHGTGAVEDDPNGEELLKKNPLEESQKYVSIISKFAPNRFETWMLQYDVAIRRKKYLLALQALFRAHAIDADRSEYLSRLVDFATKMKNTGDLPGAVGAIIKEETPRLMENQPVTEFLVAAAASIRKNGSTASLPTRTAVAKALVEAKSCSVSDAAALIVDGGISARGLSVQTCQAALTALKAFGEGATSATENWLAQVKERFPLAQGLS